MSWASHAPWQVPARGMMAYGCSCAHQSPLRAAEPDTGAHLDCVGCRIRSTARRLHTPSYITCIAFCLQVFRGVARHPAQHAAADTAAGGAGQLDAAATAAAAARGQRAGNTRVAVAHQPTGWAVSAAAAGQVGCPTAFVCFTPHAEPSLPSRYCCPDSMLFAYRGSFGLACKACTSPPAPS